jgi:conjugative relaxase-like TrwC/TraI family protein
MLSISHTISATQAADYYDDEYSNAALLQADHYQEKGSTSGEWFGKLAEELGLTGDVTKEQFLRVFDGKDPNTGEELIRHIESRRYTNKYGEVVETLEHRAGWDATFSMPKSLVILAYMGGNEVLKQAIWRAHLKAVNKALGELEGFACARVDGKWERSGKIVAALYHHERARPDEETGYASPEIHTHAVIVNMTEWGDKIRAMQEIELFRSQRYLTTVYRSELAIEAQKLGIELRVDLNTGAPESTGISREYIEAISMRSNEIKRKEAEMKERLEADGSTVKDGAGLRQAAAKLHRKGKNFDAQEMARRDAAWEAKFNSQAHRELAAIVARGPIVRTEEEIARRAKQATTYAIAAAEEREAVNDLLRVLATKALQRNMTLTNIDAIKAEMGARVASGELVRIERDQKMPERTSRKMLRLEGGNVRTLLDGKGNQEPIASSHAARTLIDDVSYRNGIRLNTNQFTAAMKLLGSEDRITILQGRAGGGKTTLMKVFREGAERAGFAVQGVAPTNMARKELQKSGVRSKTLESIIRSNRKKDADAGSKRYYIIDESSLADTRRMTAFFKRIGAEDRVLFVGDRDQHQAIEAGAPFEQLQHYGVEVIWMTEVVRQRDPGYRAAVTLLQAGKIREAIELLQRQGRIIEVPDDPASDFPAEERFKTVAKLFVRNPENCLSVDPSNLGRVVTNAQVHKLLQEAGRVAPINYRTSILVNSRDLTGSDRKWAGAYRPGDILRYRDGSRVYGVKKGEYAMVTGIDFEKNLLTVKFKDRPLNENQVMEYDPERLYGVEVFKEDERDFAVGDRVQFRRGTEDGKAANGELGIIEEIKDGKFLVRLQDGEAVIVEPKRLPHIDYGYCLTSYSSQGQTAARQLAHIDTRIDDVLVNERFTKVALTRGQDDIVIVTESIADLAGALERQRNKSIAIDALRESEELREMKVKEGTTGETPPLFVQNGELKAEELRMVDSILEALERVGGAEFEHVSLDPEIPESLPESMCERVILGEALIAEMRYKWAKLDTMAARDHGEAFRLRVHDKSADEERNMSQLDVMRRAEVRGARVAGRLRGVGANERRGVRERLTEQDVTQHSETLREHSQALNSLIKQREEKEAQALVAHTETRVRAGNIEEKHRGRGDQNPTPFISRETLNKAEDQAIRHGLIGQIETLEKLREALAPEHGFAMRTKHEAARLSAQTTVARIAYQAQVERLTSFENTRHLHRYEIEPDRKKYSLADVDQAIEWWLNKSKTIDKKYRLNLNTRARAAAAEAVEYLSKIREKMVERINERGKEIAGKVEEARNFADALQAAHDREKAIFITHGLQMAAPVFSGDELKRLETDLPTVGDVNLLDQLSRQGKGVGRALAREVIAEIKCREAADELGNFQGYGASWALPIDSDSGIRSYRLQDVRRHSAIGLIFEKKEDCALRKEVEEAAAAHYRRLAGKYERSIAYLLKARELAAEQRQAAGKGEVKFSDIELTAGEQMMAEIFAEKRQEERERRHYLQIARESSEYKTEEERRREERREDREKRHERQAEIPATRLATDSPPTRQVEAKRRRRQTQQMQPRERQIEKDGPGAARRSESITRNEGATRERLAVRRTPQAFTKAVKQNQRTYEWKDEPQPKLIEVTRSDPCRICKKKKWCSRRETDRNFVICKNVESDHPAKNGKGWVHILDGDSSSRAPQTMQVKVEVTQYERADISRRNEINNRLLSVLRLNDRDRRNLIRRGLDEATIEKNGYKSVPTTLALEGVMRHFKAEDLRGIPGFFRQGERWRLNIGEWVSKKDDVTHSFHQGFVVPVRDPEDRIVGLQIRRVEVKTDEPRYIWLSSSKKEEGTSSGAPIHYRNIEQARTTGQVILTEGALKADVAAYLLNDKYAVIAVAGVSAFSDDFARQLREQIPELRQVVIAFDADAGRKKEVRDALERLRGSQEEPNKGILQKAGLAVRELRWEESQGKGIDDYLIKDPSHRKNVESFLNYSQQQRQQIAL